MWKTGRMTIAIVLTAIATVAIAMFTFFLCRYNKKLWEATEKLWKTTAESIELAKQEFVTSHHPKLRLHSVSLDYGSIQVGGIGRAWKIQCFIDNIGGSAATIKESNLTFKKLEDPLPGLLPFSEESHALIEKPIAHGEYTIGLLYLSLQDDAIKILRQYETALNAGSQMTKTDLYLFGYIDYLDNIGASRRTAFCRQYNIKTKRFTRVKDEDHEYSY